MSKPFPKCNAAADYLQQKNRLLASGFRISATCATYGLPEGKPPRGLFRQQRGTVCHIRIILSRNYGEASVFIDNSLVNLIQFIFAKLIQISPLRPHQLTIFDGYGSPI